MQQIPNLHSQDILRMRPTYEGKKEMGCFFVVFFFSKAGKVAAFAYKVWVSGNWKTYLHFQCGCLNRFYFFNYHGR